MSRKQGTVIPKSSTAVMVAATVAAAFTVLSPPPAEVAAGALPQAAAAPARSCAEHPWPYLGCVGTADGGAPVRLVRTGRLTD